MGSVTYEVKFNDEANDNLVYSKVKLGLTEAEVLSLALRLLRHAADYEKITFQDGEKTINVRIK